MKAICCQVFISNEKLFEIWLCDYCDTTYPRGERFKRNVTSFRLERYRLLDTINNIISRDLDCGDNQNK